MEFKYTADQLRNMEDSDLKDAYIKELSDYWTALLNEIPEEELDPIMRRNNGAPAMEV